MPFASQVEAGNVSIIRAEWNSALIAELQDFPWSKKDDQVDAVVRAFTVLADRPLMSPSMTFSIFDR
jgi:predicted phage terminase large subunit-like protein